jgi:hypothetical protein
VHRAHSTSFGPSAPSNSCEILRLGHFLRRYLRKPVSHWLNPDGCHLFAISMDGTSKELHLAPKVSMPSSDRQKRGIVSTVEPSSLISVQPPNSLICVRTGHGSFEQAPSLFPDTTICSEYRGTMNKENGTRTWRHERIQDASYKYKGNPSATGIRLSLSDCTAVMLPLN